MDGLVIQSTIKDPLQAEKVALQFVSVIRAALDAFGQLEHTDAPELVTVRSQKLEYVLTMANDVHGVEKSDYFFIVARDPAAVKKAAQ